MLRLARRLAPVLVLALALAACGKRTVREVRGHQLGRQALGAVKLGTTTPTEVETRFGAPDEREPDGSFTYKYSTVRRVDRLIAGLAIPGREEVEQHTVTFRFENGVLSKVCQTRS